MLNIYYILALFSFCSSLKVCGDGKCICDLETIRCTGVIIFPRFKYNTIVSTKKIALKTLGLDTSLGVISLTWKR